MHDYFDRMSYTSGMPRRHSINFYFPFVTVNACNEIYAAVPQSITLFMYLPLSTVALFIRIDFLKFFSFSLLVVCRFIFSEIKCGNSRAILFFAFFFFIFVLYLAKDETKQ